ANSNSQLIDGPALAAQFSGPRGLTFAGALYIADTRNDAVRVASVALQLDRIAPARGPSSGGTQVRVYGAGFVAGQTRVSFGGVSATNVTQVSSAELLVATPQHAAGAVDVVVSTPSDTATLAAAYSYVAPPSITAVSPAKGRTAGGEAVTITGNAFESDTEFFFGSARATQPIIIDSATASVKTPPGAHGVVDVIARTAGGEARLTNGFRYWAPPIISGFTPASGATGTLVTVTGTAFDSDATGNLVRFGAIPANVIAASETSFVVAVPAGPVSAPIFVTTAGGSAFSATAFVIPVVTAISIEPATAEIEPGSTQQFTARATWSDGRSTDVTTTVTWSSSNTQVATIATSGLARGVASGSTTVEATLTGITATARLTIRSTEPLPADPAAVAPPTDRTIAQTFDDTTRFLYSGADPIQTGVAAGAIDARRAAVMRGRVLTRDGTPLGGATVTIVGRPELGQTLSRADGMYDLAVNGGGRLTVRYERAGHLPIERQPYVAWNEFTVIDDVALTPLDVNVTTIASGSPSLQVARGGRMTDSDGARQATVLFPAGTTAALVMPDGSTQSPVAINVRATEYTVGANGAKAMPAELPPASAYTYCVELSADEAIAAGATEVRFSKPVFVYVENFLGFRVGGIVPSGYYDRQRGTWIASTNGRIVRITAISNGMADLDVTGDGFADSGSTLTNLGIDDAERLQLASLYTAGQSFWRVPVTHFTPWDYNWPYGVPFDAVPPSLSAPGEDPGPVEISPPSAEPDLDDPVLKCGSVIECENRGLGEAAPITGAPWTLNYRSHRTEGRSGRYTLTMQLTGASLPRGVKNVELEIQVAGERVRKTFPPQPNLTYRYTWNGRNPYGQHVEGGMNPQVHVGYSYDMVYQGPYAFGLSFGRVSNTRDTLRIGRMEVTLWQTLSIQAPQRGGASLRGAWTNKAAALGGWSLSAHHAYDPRHQVLYLGSGEQRNAQPVIAPFAGMFRKYGHKGDGGPATEAFLNEPESVAVAADGSVYIADSINFVIRKVDPSGRISTVAGIAGRSGRSPGAIVGDGGSATSAELVYPWDVEIAADGTLYIVDHATIRKVTRGGVISTVAGTNTWSPNGEGDGGPATQAKISPRGMTLGPDGTLYFLDGYGIRQVSDGIITTLVRRFDSTGYSINGFDVASGPDGSLYFVATTSQASQAIVRRWPDGRLSTLAVGADAPSGIVVARDGSIYFSSRSGSYVRRMSPDGTIVTVAGSGNTSNDDYAPPTAVGLGRSWLGRIAFGPDGSLYIADGNYSLIRKIEPSLPGGVLPDGGRIVSQDGSEVYVFDGNGRHLATVGRNGEPRLQFGYDSAGQLLSITDADGNATTVERDDDGVPIAIVAPGGQRTTFALDTNGYLSSVTNPAGETRGYSYTSTGLLLSYRDPRGKLHHYEYDDGGSLTADTAPDGGTKTLRIFEKNQQRTITFTTAEGRSERISVLRLKSGALERTVVDAAGRTTVALASTNGTTTVNGPDGTVVVTREKPDPRYGMRAPLLAEQTLRLPSGSQWTQTASRTVVLSDPADPFSLETETDVWTINGRPYTGVYDAVQRRSTLRTPGGRTSVATFDNAGRVVRTETVGLPAVDYSFNGGVLSSVSAGGRSITFTYNARQELTAVRDVLGRDATFVYDAAGRVTKQTLADGRAVVFAYDEAGNLTSITPPERPAHSMAYASNGALNRYTPPAVPEADATNYSYNRDRQLTSIARPDGQTLTFGYNAAGQLSSISGGSAEYGFSYLPAGQLATVTLGAQSLTYTYDGVLVAGVTASGTVSGAIAWALDANLWANTESVNGVEIPFGYDADGLLTSAGALTLSRDAGNGLLTGSAVGNVSDSWEYNSFGEVTNYRATVSGAPLLTMTYTRDDSGRIAAIDSRGFEYDKAGRLVRVTTGGAPIAEYAYDDNGNRTAHRYPGGSVIATYDDQDRLLTYGDTTYTYTSNGELKAKTVAGATTTFDYDALGNLRTVTEPAGRTIEYVIDGRNRRVGKKIDAALVQGWLYADQLRIVAELDPTNAVISRFVYGTRRNVPDYMIKGGVAYRIVSDHLGSPRMIVNVSDGTIAQTIEYDEFGRVLSDSNPGFQPFGFAGGLHDRDTGLVHFGARDYDPQPGRWTAKDPIAFGGGDT
ncbi:MAG TPA: IPT/TIG domain-containing protein, partial [Thermoanaerobaculia bacterium]